MDHHHEQGGWAPQNKKPCQRGNFNACPSKRQRLCSQNDVVHCTWMISSPCRRILSHRYYQMDQGRRWDPCNNAAKRLVWSSSVSGCSRLAALGLNNHQPVTSVGNTNTQSWVSAQPPVHSTEATRKGHRPVFMWGRRKNSPCTWVLPGFVTRKWRVVDLMHLSIACPRYWACPHKAGLKT